LHTQRATPRSFPAIQFVHSSLSFLGAAHIDEQIIVLAGLESLCRVRSEDFADILTTQDQYQYQSRD
jgi:hypothetical protein